MNGGAMTLELGITWWKILVLVAVIAASIKLVRYYRRRRREAKKSSLESIRARFQNTIDYLMPWEDVEVEEKIQERGSRKSVSRSSVLRTCLTSSSRSS